MPTTVTFDDGSSSITIRSPTYPYGDGPGPESARQRIGLSIGGWVKVSDRGADEERYELNFERLSDTDKTALEDFLKDDIKYHKNTFTYTDPWSVNHTSMRLWRITQKFTINRRNNRWIFGMIIRKDIGV